MSDVVLDKVYLRQCMLRDKGFFSSLYQGESKGNKKILQFSDDRQMNILIKVIYLIVNGEIAISSKNFELIKKSKRIVFLKKSFGKKKDFIKLLNNSREEKLKILTGLSSVFPFLLFGLFNEQT
jgi:hypothetical protein